MDRKRASTCLEIAGMCEKRKKLAFSTVQLAPLLGQQTYYYYLDLVLLLHDCIFQRFFWGF